MPVNEYTPIALGRVADLARRTIPERFDISAMRGDSFNLRFRMYREVDDCGYGSGVQTLTGLTGRALVRPSPDHVMSYPLSVAVDTDAGSGLVTITADALTMALMPESGVYDLELTDGTEDLRKTVVKGSWQLVRDASY